MQGPWDVALNMIILKPYLILKKLEGNLETWIGIDFSTLTVLMILIVGAYVRHQKERVDELENELENLKFDISNSLRSTGFYHHLSSESIKLERHSKMIDGMDL